ncbi:hypothetical protein GWI33_013915 [Rhynchophorus ferrugineus]|uniref:Uncharacterized protein n=1 Tax=Rhynchophorus ferrugineus TaxID=354439 RepID=A0A834MCU5_RHYFE|nr:hypothetical protein GWI33_013915 [Rhynchophorus ferrugineus]
MSKNPDGRTVYSNRPQYCSPPHLIPPIFNQDRAVPIINKFRAAKRPPLRLVRAPTPQYLVTGHPPPLSAASRHRRVVRNICSSRTNPDSGIRAPRSGSHLTPAVAKERAALIKLFKATQWKRGEAGGMATRVELGAANREIRADRRLSRIWTYLWV